MVSIVLPTYNGQKYIRESIVSCLSQTLSDFELIVINDGSTDATPEIIESFAQKDSRIRIVHNRKNIKLPASLNVGFALAKGKYHTWTSDDNAYRSNALEEMAGFLENNRTVDVVYCDCVRINQATGQLSPRIARDIETLNRWNVIGACFLYKSEVFERLNGYDENLFCVEDYDFWLRAYRGGCRFVPLHQSLYVYRDHKDSLTVQKKELIAERTAALVKHHLSALNAAKEPLPTVSGVSPGSPKIAIWGWWQGKNLGDNWIREILAGFFPGAIFISTAERDFKKYDFVICGGGGLFIRNVIAPWDRKIDVPFGVLGVGAEFPHTDRKAAELAQKADFFYLRDEYSVACMGVSKNSRSYDLTFADPLPENSRPDFNKVFFIWRDLEKLLAYPDFKKYIGDVESDSLWKEKLASRFTEIKENNFNTEQCGIDPMLSDCGFVVSGRYHGVVAAIQKGVPCIAIDICPKIRALMQEVGLEDYCLKIGEIGDLCYKIDQAKEKYHEIRLKQAEYCRIANKAIAEHIRKSIASINNRLLGRVGMHSTNAVARNNCLPITV
jgi:hypothetical protein